ncbi:hypothetical protein [Dokdonella sp.]|uniref:hypothetical protein n=1 Tax=Dokdonella sp. TaxID=2291710 RepID=UPI003783B6F2
MRFPLIAIILVLAACNGGPPVATGVHESRRIFSDKLPRPPGYKLYLLRSFDSGLPVEYYITLVPDPEHPSRRPIRDESELSALWKAAAEAYCGQRKLILSAERAPGRALAGPSIAQPIECVKYPGEADCGLSVSGAFLCEE